MQNFSTKSRNLNKSSTNLLREYFKKIMKMSCLNWLRCVTPLLKNAAAYQTCDWKYCQRWSIITKVTSFFSPFFFLLQFCVNYVASCRWPKVTSKIIGSKSESFSWTTSAWHGAGAGDRVPVREGEISTDSPWREVRLCSWEPKSLSLQGSLCYKQDILTCVPPILSLQILAVSAMTWSAPWQFMPVTRSPQQTIQVGK